MKNKEYSLEETVQALIENSKTRSTQNGEINYAYFSGCLQAFLETLAIVGPKTFCEINKKNVDAIPAP